ncbi:Phthiocerol synthesis polyketide synthase type I PpsC [Folsomia candida]|uniref:Phthiocerol synthesis polyketide synthase type I PpsC n=1 Tax=Folsomia candida TaxID=158441 RepID=A0A226DJV1_FOLCA|nr:Phthiocerol synthesis polyketide synthase type I PpsC [Folsomia candida]
MQSRAVLNDVVCEILTLFANSANKAVVRVLECGAGLGSGTSLMLDNIAKIGASHFEYTYTDISPEFLEKGDKLIRETEISAKAGLFNLDKDPFSQGLIPAHYDILVTSFVVHAARDIQEALMHMRKLLRSGGIILLTAQVASNREFNLTFGGLSGFWKLEDTYTRPWNYEQLQSISNWTSQLENCGFEDILTLQIYGANALVMAKLKSDPVIPRGTKCNHPGVWIIFSDESFLSTEVIGELHGLNFVVQSISWDRRDETETILTSASTCEDNWVGVIYLWGLRDDATTEDICKPYLTVCQSLAKLQRSLKLLTVTQGNLSTGSFDFCSRNPISSPLIGMTNVLANENPDIQCKSVDIDTSRNSAIELVTEIFMDDTDVVIDFNLSCRNPISYLIFIFPRLNLKQLAPNEVEIEVKAYALNFLDVFMVTKPDPVFDKFNYMGMDIAGVVKKVGTSCTRKVGERILMARRTGIAMPSHRVTPEEAVISIPDEMTFVEAATLPMAVLTSTNCLLDAAKPTPDDVVLIHTTSGGVGLMAIQMAQHIGCTIVVTAGNHRKRNYLRSLGLENIFNSRYTDYGRDIRDKLGRGVNIVLNSLTGPGYKEATLELCDEGARFIEMSKINIWSEDQVQKLRPDIHYQIVDVSTIPESKLVDQLKLLQSHIFGETDFKLRPLPYTRFLLSEIREALEYMEKVKHIGKIVLTMPEPDPKIIGSYSFPLFNDSSTYLITGGLGGIGLEVAKWMTSSGARNILLVGRRSPKPEALVKIDEIKRLGVNLTIELCDIGNPDDVEKLFTHVAATMLPIRGIMHAAGILDDGTWENHTWEKYQNVFQAKVNGAWNLHQTSLKLQYSLEHFVLFSSMAATLGSLGQSNYVAANQYLDSLAHYRYSHGLPVTCINWGQWCEVGLAANMSLPPFKPFTIHQGIAALEHALLSHKIQVSAYDADLASLRQVLNSTRGLLSEVEQNQSTSLSEIDSDGFWKEYDAGQDHGQKINVMKQFLKKLLRITLKMDKTEEIQDHFYFQDLGMDSLLMVEVKNGLQSSFGKRVKISITAVKDCKTVTELSGKLVELISGKEHQPPTREQLRELISQDINLVHQNKIDNRLTSTLVPLSQVECILLLGATGTLGSYVLVDLLKQQSVKKVVCLMKYNAMQSARDRFVKLMSTKNLLSEIDMEKLEFVTGDVRHAKLGMDEAVYTKLSEEVHAVFNLAVKIAFDEFYSETNDPMSSRVTNVFGVKNILEFVVSRRLEYVYHASSIVTEIRVSENHRLLEDWGDEEILELLPNSAYPISKLICDRLIAKAVENGIPCKSFRFPQIGGHSTTGANSLIDSFMMMQFFSYMYLGIMPAQNVPFSLLPVDLCSTLSVQLFFDPNAGLEMFNVFNPHLGDEVDFEDLACEFGIEIETLDPDDFIKTVEDMKQNEKLEADMLQLVQFALTYKAQFYSLIDAELPMYMSWIRGNKSIYLSEKLERLIPSDYPESIPNSWNVLRKDLQHAKELGLFDRYKIKHSKEN